MGLIRWFTKNRADTHEPTHNDLAPLVLPHDFDAAIDLLRRTVAAMPRWQVEDSPQPAELRLTRRTRAMRYVDDVVVTFQQHGSGTMIHAASRSRVGIGDLGQNRRNILELWSAVKEFLLSNSRPPRLSALTPTPFLPRERGNQPSSPLSSEERSGG
jgi:uncharacterized protein (DUF1499 family)